MEKTKAVDLLLDIATEKNGYSIGKPWRFTEFSLAAIVPITREYEGERTYRLLSEVGKQASVKDTGNIEVIEVTNRSEWPILLKAGEIVTGATQARTITVSEVVMQGEKAGVGCACVQAAIGIRMGQSVKSGGYSPPEVRNAVYDSWDYQGEIKEPVYGSPISDDVLRNFRYSNRLQNEVWGNVKESSSRRASAGANLAFMSRSIGSSMGDGADFSAAEQPWRAASNDLASRLNESKEKFASVIKSVPLFDHQAGIALLTMAGGLESLEAFDDEESWKAFRENYLNADVGKISDTSDQDAIFEFKTEKAKEAIRKLLTGDFKEDVAVGKTDTQTYVLRSDKFNGEVVHLYERPIHCTFLRKVGN